MKVFVSFVVLLFVLVAGLFFAREQLHVWSQQPQELPQEQVVQVPRGTSLPNLSASLAAQGVVDDALRFRIWVRLFSDYSEFQAGQYRFVDAVSPAEIAAKIRSGDVYQPVVLEVTIPEGFRLEQIFDRFVKAGVGSKEEFQSVAEDERFLRAHGIPGNTLEGFFYPATYRFYEVPTARAVVEKGIEVFFNRLPEDYEAHISRMGLTLYEAVIFASLIELETKFDDERPLVSEVIWARYRDGVALGIDATIIYGIEDYQGNLTRKHLRDAKNIYNTRMHLGLPPTPIGSPSVESLKAVLTPSDYGYYYYVLSDELNGRHSFSKTLREHNAKVRKLVRAQRMQARKARAETREARRAERQAARRSSGE